MAAPPDPNAAAVPPEAGVEGEVRELPFAGWLDGVLTQAIRALVDAFKAPDAWFPGLFYPGFVLLVPWMGQHTPPAELDRKYGGPLWRWGHHDDRVWWLMDSDRWVGLALLVFTVLCAAQAGVVFARMLAAPDPKLPDLGKVLDLKRSEWGPALPLLIARAVLSTGLFLMCAGVIGFLDFEVQLDEELIWIPTLLLGGFSAIYVLLFDAATQLGLQSLAVHRRGSVSALRHGVRLLRAHPGRASRWIVSQALLLFGLPVAGYQLGKLTGLEWIVQVAFVGLMGASLALLWSRAFTDLGGRRRDGSLVVPTPKNDR
jgi:hypothetical protein